MSVTSKQPNLVPPYDQINWNSSIQILKFMSTNYSQWMQMQNQQDVEQTKGQQLYNYESEEAGPNSTEAGGRMKQSWARPGNEVLHYKGAELGLADFSGAGFCWVSFYPCSLFFFNFLLTLLMLIKYLSIIMHLCYFISEWMKKQYHQPNPCIILFTYVIFCLLLTREFIGL